MRILLPFAVIGYLAIALVWPCVRTWRRTGVFPVVLHREGSPVQRLLGLVLAFYLVGLVVWSFLVALLSESALGLWQVQSWFIGLGWTLTLGGTALTLAAQLDMSTSWRVGIDDRPTKLVTRGLFRYSRNPIFSGMLVSLLGMTMIAPALWSALGLLVAWVLIPVQVRLEEQHLRQLHGAAYLDYASQVGRFAPWLGRFVSARR